MFHAVVNGSGILRLLSGECRELFEAEVLLSESAECKERNDHPTNLAPDFRQNNVRLRRQALDSLQTFPEVAQSIGQKIVRR